VINFGSNFEISVGDTVNLITEVMNKQVEIETDQDRLRPDNSEVERRWADNSKAKDMLDWTPAYAGREGFKRGLTATVEWFLHKENLQAYKANIYNV
jgi:dTDP-glucose 4,6-dehydratase